MFKFSLVVIYLLISSSTLYAETSIIGNKNGKDIVTVRVNESSQSRQSLPIFPGISTTTAGAKKLIASKSDNTPRRIGRTTYS